MPRASTPREDPPPGRRGDRPRDDHAHRRRPAAARDRAAARRRQRARTATTLQERARPAGLDRLLPPAAAARGRRHAHARRGDAADHLAAPRRPRAPLPRPRRRADARPRPPRRRCSSASSCARSSSGSFSPNLRVELADRLDLRQPLGRVDLQQLGEVVVADREAVGVEPVRASARGRSACRAASTASSQRRNTHSSTRAFSPKPGPQPAPVARVLAEPVDVEDLRQHRAVAAADLEPVARSSRPCGSRRTAASRTGRGAACRPRRPPRRSSRSP